MDGDGIYLTNSLNGSNNPERAATRDIVVLSPPGMMRASHFARSAGVRTSVKVQWIAGVVGESREAAEWRRRICSWKAPWRARTPTVMGVIGEKGFWGGGIYKVVKSGWGREIV